MGKVFSKCIRGVNISYNEIQSEDDNSDPGSDHDNGQDLDEIAKLGYCYKMDHKNRGIALIFNHEYYLNPHVPQRIGTAVDRDRLHEVYTALGFDVRIYNDYNLHQIEDILKSVSETNHSDNDCLIVTIMSHGNYVPYIDERNQLRCTILSHDLNSRIRAHDQLYLLQKVFRYFSDTNCPSLKGKPRLFFIQACQGDDTDAGFKMEGRKQRAITTPEPTSVETDMESTVLGPQTDTNKLPTFLPHKDFFVAFSSFPGYVSFRCQLNGSWFIRALCDAIEKRTDDQHLVTILTFVTQYICYEKESKVDDLEFQIYDKKKQVPLTYSNLTKLLFFPKNETMY